MTLEELRENIIDLVDLECPFVEELNRGAVSVDDMIDHIIYEGIKCAYDDYAEKKSVRQHLIDNGMDTDSERRKFSRALQYAQHYRDLQYEEMLHTMAVKEERLQGKDMTSFEKRKEGHEINAMHFVELCNMRDIPILNKIIGKQIQSTKKVSNTKFMEMVDEYEKYIDKLENEMDSDEKILFNTELYFTLEWKYNIDLVYDIVLTAEEKGYPAITKDNVRWMCGTVMIPPSSWFRATSGTECRMIMHRHKYLTAMFDDMDEAELYERDRLNAVLYQVYAFIKMAGMKKTITELVKETTIHDRAEFIKNRYWIWQNRKRKEWTPERIKYARTVYNLIYQDVEQPKIK